MTYNFDVEAWFERELQRFETLKARGDLDEQAYATALEDLERRAEEMQTRLDGSFPVGSRDAPGPAPRTPAPKGTRDN